MGRFVMLALCLVGGILLLKYTEPIKRLTGDIGFAEKYLGSGGTYTLIKLIALGIIIFGFVYASGQLDIWFCKYGGALVGGCSVDTAE